MSYEVYKVLHLLAIFFLFLSLGTVAAAGRGEGLGRMARIAHGVALVLILVAGFGLLARLGLGAPPGWVWAKIALWVVLAAAVAPLGRRPEWTPVLWPMIPILGGIAAWLAVVKPF